MLLNLFAFSRSPSAQTLPPEIRAAGDALVTDHNAELLSLASRANGAGGARVIMVDLHRLMEATAAQPDLYGFTMIDRPCLPDNHPPECVSPSDARQRLFWDGSHLSSAGQALVYEAVSGTRHAQAEVLIAAAAELGIPRVRDHALAVALARRIASGAALPNQYFDCAARAAPHSPGGGACGSAGHVWGVCASISALNSGMPKVATVSLSGPKIS